MASIDVIRDEREPGLIQLFAVGVDGGYAKTPRDTTGELTVEIVDPNTDEILSPGSLWCLTCLSEEGKPNWPCPTLRLLAQPYADHPDYRDEWSGVPDSST